MQDAMSEGWELLTAKLAGKVQLVADLFVINSKG